MRLRTTLAAIVLAGATAVPAQGQEHWDWESIINADTYVGGNAFDIHAAMQLSYWGDTNGCETSDVCYLRLIVTNLGVYGEVYKAIGLINLPSLDLITVGKSDQALRSNDPNDWTEPPPNDLSGAGLLPDQWAFISPNPAPHIGLQVGEEATFYFRLSGLDQITDFEVLDLGAGVHAISGPLGCSGKMGVLGDGNGEGTVIENYDQAATAECFTTVVPEPMTVVLLGTGLVGLGIAARRRNTTLEDEDGQEVTL